MLRLRSVSYTHLFKKSSDLRVFTFAEETVGGLLEDDDIPADSRTETFAALKVSIANRRWEGTPFYLRAGKRLGLSLIHIFPPCECTHPHIR